MTIKARVLEAGDVEDSDMRTRHHAAILQFDSEADLDAALDGAAVELEVQHVCEHELPCDENGECELDRSSREPTAPKEPA